MGGVAHRQGVRLAGESLRNLSAMPSVSTNREAAVHFWPVLRNAPSITCSTARSKSASSSTTAAFLPHLRLHRNSVRGGRGGDLSAHSGGASEGDRVDSVVGNQGVADHRVAHHQVQHPGGRPASVSASARRTASNGTALAGFHTTVFPKTKAGAIFHAGMAIGKLNGVITATTPRACGSPGSVPRRAGRRRSRRPAGPLGSVVAQDLGGAAYLADAFGFGLALLEVSSNPQASACRSTTAAAAARIAPRAWIRVPAHPLNALRAASTAFSTSAAAAEVALGDSLIRMRRLELSSAGPPPACHRPAIQLPQRLSHVSGTRRAQ